MKTSELELLLKEGEGLSVEFKEHFTAKIDRDVVAFANTSGGKIILGVKDDGNVVGEKLTNVMKAKIHDLARNCEPEIDIKKIEQISNTVVITIDESSQKPHSCSAGFYRRLDAATQKMNQRELKLLFKKVDASPGFERAICKSITLKDISLEKIKHFLVEAKINLEKVDPKDILLSLNLMEGNKINNAGVMFFAKDPRFHIFHCETILAAFKGTDRVHIYDRIDVQNDLLTQFNEAMLFLRKHLNIRSEIINEKRYDKCEIPFEALREAVANALIHRDYSMTGTSLMVEVHEDRVTISNPGGIPEGMNIKELSLRSVRRNELIADLFSRVDQAERMASGIRRIMKLIAEAGLKEPIIKSDVFFEISFMRDPKYKVGSTDAEKETDTSLSHRQKEILEVLERGKELSSSEILETLSQSVSERTLQRDLQKLKQLNQIDTTGMQGPKTRWFIRK